MDREDVYRRVTETAERFGAGNPQQIKLLCSQLSAAPPDELLSGLLLVVSRCDPAAPNYQPQELAGRILAALRPKAKVDLARCLREILPTYNASIEQIPQYFESRCGKLLVLNELHLIESENPQTRAAASSRTMRWWLGDST
ncbi:hypothetical protein [Roseateles sp. BYS96W]|uniref:Uncharacterized protein n=1 Tax=Pelomonas nitida TaxID=3299027 RepID=A0ABW7GD56_9BURK